MVPAFAAVHHHNRFVQEEAVHGSSDIAEVKVLLLVAVNFKIQHKNTAQNISTFQITQYFLGISLIWVI